MTRKALSSTKTTKKSRKRAVAKAKNVLGELIPKEDVDEIEQCIDGLSDRAKAFVLEFPKDYNPTKAAIRAGYSEIAARQQAHVLLTNPTIRDAIALARDSRFRAISVTADRIIAEYAKIGFLNPKLFYNDDGSLRDITTLPDDVAACISGIEIEHRREDDGDTEITTKKVKLADKLSALNALAKMAAFSGTFGKQTGDGGDTTNNVQFNYTVNLSRG